MFCSFWVRDIAKHQDGRWRLVELNDGNMSGLSCIGPTLFYSNLKNATEQEAT